MVYPSKFCTRMYLYVDISKIALSSLYLQPVICYSTAKSLIMCFQRHEIQYTSSLLEKCLWKPYRHNSDFFDTSYPQATKFGDG